jgi:hypothetical protein
LRDLFLAIPSHYLNGVCLRRAPHVPGRTCLRPGCGPILSHLHRYPPHSCHGCGRLPGRGRSCRDRPHGKGHSGAHRRWLMRALGFQRKSVLISFLVESLLLGLTGGFADIFFASFLQSVTISALNFRTFSELAFSFSMTPSIFLQALSFALIMGFVGGVLPAVRAAHMNITDSLRAG